MPYVDRDGTGKITGIFQREQRVGQEYIADDHADIVAHNLGDIKEGKYADLIAAFNADLNAGFVSNALGNDHHYDSEQHNRENLIGAVAAGVEQPYTCDDQLGNADSKQQRLHDAAQMKQVLIDGAVVKQTLIAKLRDLRAQVEAAGDEAAVDAINW